MKSLLVGFCWSLDIPIDMGLKQGCVPDELKVARVNHIYKIGSTDDLSN